MSAVKSATARLDAFAPAKVAVAKAALICVKPTVLKPGTKGLAAPFATAPAKDVKTANLANFGNIIKALAKSVPANTMLTSSKAGTTVKSLNVKPQNQYDGSDQNACGTTSLAMVMDYFYPGRAGNNHNVIDKEIRRADLFSTPDNLASYAEDHGLRSSVKTEASLSDIKGALDKGLPVQVVIDPDGNKGDFTTHFVVVEGYEQDAAGNITKLNISDPAGAKKYSIDADTFMKRWSDLNYSNVPSGMSRMMITYAPTDNRPIKGLDGVTRRANDIDLPGNSLLHDIFSNSTPARTLGNGISDVVSGAANLQLGTFLGGIVKTVGGAVGTALSIGGGYAQKGGQAAIAWGKKKWNKGGLGNKILGGLAVVGGGIAKGAGWVVQKAGNAIGWVAGKVGDAVKAVGNKIGDAAKAVGKGIRNAAKAVGKGIKNAAKAVGNGVKKAAKAVGNGVKNAAKAVGNGIKKIFSGW